MGDEIIIKSIEVIYGGLIQIDFLNVDKNEYSRAFCEADKFFNMIGTSMKKEYAKKMEEFSQTEGNE